MNILVRVGSLINEFFVESMGFLGVFYGFLGVFYGFFRWFLEDKTTRSSSSFGGVFSLVDVEGFKRGVLTHSQNSLEVYR